MTTKTKKNGVGHVLDLDSKKVEKAWRKNRENCTAAARDLNCSASTVRYHLKKLGLLAPSV